MKGFILLAFMGILGALAAAGFFMLRRPGQDGRPEARKDAMAKALAVRVGLSILLFLIILGAYGLGWIEPRGNPLRG